MKKILLLVLTVFLFSTNVFAEQAKDFKYDYTERCKKTDADADADVDIDCKDDKEYLGSALKGTETERVSILKEINAEVSQCANGSLSLFELGGVEECQEIILGNFCDNKKTDSKIAGKKCENKTKIAKSINEKFSAYLTIPAVKDVCKKILITTTNKIETNVLKLDGIETSYIRKCRSGARKYERLEKRAKNVDGKSDKKLAETECLIKADFKKIDKCIKKVKIQYKLNSDFKEYLSKTSVKDACKKDLINTTSSLIAESWKKDFSLKDLKKCQKSVKKMKKLTSKAEKNKNADTVCLDLPTLAKVKSCVKDFVKAKKVCKKLKRKLKNGTETEPNCEIIASQDKLKKYEDLLKVAKEKLSADRKENRTKKI